MKAIHYFSLTAFAMLISCHETCYVEKDCIAKILQEYNMVPYDDQELGCNSFLVLYKFDGEQYFLVNNHCADMVSYPFDCTGNKLCEIDGSPKCLRFYETAEYIDIIGIADV